MKYTMKGGTLCLRETPVMQIKSVFTGPEKAVFSPDGQLLLRTSVRVLDVPREKMGDVRFRRYLLTDSQGREVACAAPDYAADEDPSVFGWPVYRMPRVDHARLSLNGTEYRLVMKDSRNYLLERCPGQAAAKLVHCGLVGGWDIEAEDGLPPELICGVFVLCRYIEQENEFLAV